MRLTPNFTLAELTVTSKPYPNVPNAREIQALTYVCRTVLEPVRLHFGGPVIVNSGFRSAAVNRAVGSSAGSQHRRGEAVDCERPGVTNLLLAQWIRDNLPFDQLILEAYRPGVPGSGWVHVSTFDRSMAANAQRPLRRSVLTMTMGSHGPVYSKGLNG